MAAVTLADISLHLDNIVIDAPIPQVASTVLINEGSGMSAATSSLAVVAPLGTGASAIPAASQGAQVVAGQGTNGKGDACGCSCLCGVGSAAPPNAGQGNFGGVVGVMPDQVGTAPTMAAMAPAPAAPSAGSPPA